MRRTLAPVPLVSVLLAVHDYAQLLADAPAAAVEGPGLHDLSTLLPYIEKVRRREGAPTFGGQPDYENLFRQRAGSAGYPGGFVDHYIVSLIYPAGLTRGIEVILGGAVLLMNVIIYMRVFR